MRRHLFATLSITMWCLLPGATPAPAQDGTEAATDAGTGTAIVRVVTEPEVSEGATFVFTGVPSGELELADGGRGSLSADGVAVGSHVAKLSEIDSEVAAAGYELTAIRCDDEDSTGPSLGKLDNDAAIFRLEASETVTCEFVLEKRKVGAVRTGADCICPEEGRWNVQNLEGSMDCRGAFVLNRKLKPVRDTGIILVMEEDCSQVFGDSATKKEEDTLMTRVDDCTYEGVFESEEENVDMVIDVVWTIESRERITGEMSSSTTQMGITCDYYRPFELTFDEPLSDKEYEKWEQRIRKKMSRMN